MGNTPSDEGGAPDRRGDKHKAPVSHIRLPHETMRPDAIMASRSRQSDYHTHSSNRSERARGKSHFQHPTIPEYALADQTDASSTGGSLEKFAPPKLSDTDDRSALTDMARGYASPKQGHSEEENTGRSYLPSLPENEISVASITSWDQKRAENKEVWSSSINEEGDVIVDRYDNDVRLDDDEDDNKYNKAMTEVDRSLMDKESVEKESDWEEEKQILQEKEADWDEPMPKPQNAVKISFIEKDSVPILEPSPVFSAVEHAADVATGLWCGPAQTSNWSTKGQTAAIPGVPPACVPSSTAMATQEMRDEETCQTAERAELTLRKAVLSLADTIDTIEASKDEEDKEQPTPVSQLPQQGLGLSKRDDFAMVEQLETVKCNAIDSCGFEERVDCLMSPEEYTDGGFKRISDIRSFMNLKMKNPEELPVISEINKSSDPAGDYKTNGENQEVGLRSFLSKDNAESLDNLSSEQPDDDDFDMSFIRKYQAFFDEFLWYNPGIAAKNPQLLENLRVAKLQKLLESAMEAETTLEQEVDNLQSSHKVDDYQTQLVEASRQKLSRESQFQLNLQEIHHETRDIQARLFWKALVQCNVRAKKQQLLLKNLFDKESNPDDILSSLPDSSEAKLIRDAVSDTDGYPGDEEAKLRQYQVDNAFLNAEVQLLETKLAELEATARKHSWVDSVFLRLNAGQMKMLKGEFQNKIGVKL